MCKWRISGYNLGQAAVVCGCFSSIRLLHISLSASYLPPQILHSLCISFFLVITAVPREIEKKCLCIFFSGGGGANNIRFVRDVQVANIRLHNDIMVLSF